MPVMRSAMRCGENSLPIYCLGVLLALASHATLLDISDGLAMQIVLSLGGILLMVVAAVLLNSIKAKPGRQPPRMQPTEPVTATLSSGLDCRKKNHQTRGWAAAL